MSDLLEHEPVIRSSVFAAVLLVMLIWEVLAPRRTLVVPRRVRWVSNVALSFINTAVLRFAFPMLAVGLAALMESRGWGVFNVLGAACVAGACSCCGVARPGHLCPTRHIS